MTKKEKFLAEVLALTEDNPENTFSPDSFDYWKALNGEEQKVKFTDNGKLILNYIKENKDAFNNLFKAKDVGEGVGISSRGASGAMRKLVNDGYLEKMGENPVVYALTSLGEQTNPDEE